LCIGFVQEPPRCANDAGMHDAVTQETATVAQKADIKSKIASPLGGMWTQPLP